MIRVPPQRGGWLEVVCGPMFSGKSRGDDPAAPARGDRRAAGRRLQAADRRPLRRRRRRQPRRRADARDPGRLRRRRPARAEGYDVVGIDEVQFFEATVSSAALALADRGVRVICAGLDQDFRRLPFGPMPELLARAEFVDKLQAVCQRCGGPATTTQRLRRRASRRRTRARRSSSARSTRTRPAAATATGAGADAAPPRRLAHPLRRASTRSSGAGGSGGRRTSPSSASRIWTGAADRAAPAALRAPTRSRLRAAGRRRRGRRCRGTRTTVVSDP